MIKTKTKRIATVVLCLALCSASLSLFSQSQIRNGGFEYWEGSDDNIEPTNWNSFMTSDCSISGFLGGIACAAAKGKQVAESSDTRPGSPGLKSARIWSRSVVTEVANGNLTTGRVQIRSSTPSHSSNCNITKRTDDNFRCPLTEKPDSIVFWAKFVCASPTTEARMHAIIHTAAVDYNDPGGSSSDVVADALLEFPRGSQTWTRYSVPFIDGAAQTPAYILITFTTNTIPGGGSANDALYIDDIELIYNKELLASISLDGTPLAGFADTTNVYAHTLDSCSLPLVEATAKNTGSILEVVPNRGAKQAVITVKQHALDTLRRNIYTINFTTPVVAVTIDTLYDAFGPVSYNDTLKTASKCDSIITVHLPKAKAYEITLDNTPVSGFNMDSNNYTISLTSCIFPVITQVTPTDGFTTIVQPVIQADIITKQASVTLIRGTNDSTRNTYTITFTTPEPDTVILYDAPDTSSSATTSFGTNGCDSVTFHRHKAKLTAILLDNVAIAEFKMDSNDYTVNLTTCNFPNVTTTMAAGSALKVPVVQATMNNKQVVITVQEGSNDSTINTYTLTFTTPAPTRDTLYDDPLVSYIETLTAENGCDSIVIHLVTKEKLDTLQLDGVNLTNFDPENSSYDVPLDSCTFPRITKATAATKDVAVIVTIDDQPDPYNRQATITVKNGTNTSTENTYTINYITPFTKDTVWDKVATDPYIDTLKSMEGCDSLIEHLVPKAKLDSIWIDGILLTDILLTDFHPDTLNYNVALNYCTPPIVTAKAETDATIDTIIQSTIDNKKAIIRIIRGTIALSENTYTLTFTTPEPDTVILYDAPGTSQLTETPSTGTNGCDSVTIHLPKAKAYAIALDGVDIDGFKMDSNNYTKELDSCTFPVVTVTTGATVDTIIQATSDDKQAKIILVRGTDDSTRNTYTVTFITPEPERDTIYDAYGLTFVTDVHKSTNGCDSLIVHAPKAKALSIELDGIPVPDFDMDTNNYTVDWHSCILPVVTVTATAEATVDSIIQPTSYNKQVEIKVRNGTDNRTETVYTISFTTPSPFIDTVYDAVGTPYTERLKGVNNCDSIMVHLLSTGIVSIGSNGNTVLVYPNPAETFIDIQSTYPVTDVEVYDMAGQLVRKENNIGRTQFRLNVDNLTKGVYSLRIITSKGTNVKKVVLN